MNLKKERFKYVTKTITRVIKMITIIKPGFKKIIKLFYENNKAEFHLREIARETKLHEPSTFRFLKQLEENNAQRHRKVSQKRLIF